MRADHFKENRPYQEMKSNLARGGRAIHLAQSEPALDHQKGRKRAGDQQRVVELIVQEPICQVRFQQPTVKRIKAARQQEQSIA